jgi:hypothetical protein
LGLSNRVPQLPPRHRRVRAGAVIMTTASELDSVLSPTSMAAVKHGKIASPSMRPVAKGGKVFLFCDDLVSINAVDALIADRLTGTRIKLGRPSDREQPCCGNIAIITAGNLPHHANLVCAECGRDRGRLPAVAITFVQETRALFGAPDDITLRSLSGSRPLPGAGDEEQIHSATGDNPPMKREEIFPSKYLKASDLNNPIVVTIDNAPLEVLKNPEGKEQSKVVLYFRGAKKALPLNVTNWDAVAAICGADTDEWPGGRIELYADTTRMGGKNVDCIRVRAPRQREQAPPKAAAPEADDMDDAIPF